MSTLAELLLQRESLEQAIKEARNAEESKALATIRELVAQYGLSASDIFGTKKSTKVTGRKNGTLKAKFKDPVTGVTWSGRGKTPKWLENKDHSKFAVTD